MTQKHVGFLMNIPAEGNAGTLRALKRQGGVWSKFIPENKAQDFAAALSPEQVYFGAAPPMQCGDDLQVIVHILGIPGTTTSLMDPNHRLHLPMKERLLQGPADLVRLARHPLDVLGLGATCSIAIHHGRGIFRKVKDLVPPIPLVTNGDTITAGLAVEIASMALTERGQTPKSIGVLGGFGSVGSRVVALAAERFQPAEIVITTGDATKDRAEDLAKLEKQFPQTRFRVGSLKEAAGCSLAFLATSSAATLPIEPDWPARNGIYLDIGKPLNTNPALAKARPDLLILDGSLANLPSGSGWEKICHRLATPPNAIFGCLSETITLAHLDHQRKLADHYGKPTFIGRPDLGMAHLMMDAALAAGLTPCLALAHRPD